MYSYQGTAKESTRHGVKYIEMYLNKILLRDSNTITNTLIYKCI